MASKLIEKREELQARQKTLARIFEQAGPDLDLGLCEDLKNFQGTAAKAGEVKRLNAELTGIGVEVDDLAEVERVAQSVKRLSEPQGTIVPQTAKGEVKSLGQMFTESQAYKAFNGRQGPAVELPIDAKTLMTTSAGWAPENIRQPGYVASAQYAPSAVDIIPGGTTNQAAVVYMLETTYTNNSAERTEGANNAGENALALTATTSNVREIAAWIPVTREQMDDVPYVQSYVNQRMSFMLRARLGTQIMAGNNVAPNLGGLITLAGQTQAKGADPTPDAIYKAMTLIRTTGRAEPNATIWHPNDWQDVRLLRTVDGVYIWGSPSEAGPARIWGLPVILDTGCTENTAVVLDTGYTQLLTKQGVQLEVTDSHASLFIQRTLAILATVRVAFVIYRTGAVCTVTGL